MAAFFGRNKLTHIFPHIPPQASLLVLQLRQLLVVSAALAGLAACSQPYVALRSLPPVNRNAEGESLPVKVRLYALKDDARFAAAPFATLWTHDQQVLGDDRLGDPKVVIIPPGEVQAGKTQIEPERHFLGELPEGTRFIGVLCLYPHADEPERRRAVVPVNKLHRTVISLLDSSVVAQADGDDPPARTAPPPPAPPPPPITIKR